MVSRTRQVEKVLTETQPEGPVCHHEWLIASPSGPSSKGACRLCGEKREFLNYIEGSSWGYDVSLEQLAGGSRFPKNVVNDETTGLADEE